MSRSSVSGISSTKLVEAHGSFSSSSCTLCRSVHDPEAVKTSILSGPGVPQCGVNGCKVSCVYGNYFLLKLNTTFSTCSEYVLGAAFSTCSEYVLVAAFSMCSEYVLGAAFSTCSTYLLLPLMRAVRSCVRIVTSVI